VGGLCPRATKEGFLNLKINKNTRSKKVQCCLELLHSLGIRCHILEMTLLKNNY
jgi:hypothetical protein